MSQLHIRYDGQSIDVETSALDVGDVSTDQQIREAAAQHLGIPAVKLAVFAIDKNAETGDITLRPQAIFG